MKIVKDQIGQAALMLMHNDGISYCGSEENTVRVYGTIRILIELGGEPLFEKLKASGAITPNPNDILVFPWRDDPDYKGID